MRASQIRPASRWLTAILALVVALGCQAAAHERPITTPAAHFVQGTVATALALARPPMTHKAEDRLDALVRDSMDWTGLTRFAIGRYRAELGEGGVSRVRAQIERQLGMLARRAGRELPGLTLAIEDMRIDPDGNRHVLGAATLPRFGEIEVEWVLAPARSGYRIADIKALGLTLRQFLRGWVAGLIAAKDGDVAAAFEDPAAATPE
jgi:hypothetical protein